MPRSEPVSHDRGTITRIAVAFGLSVSILLLSAGATVQPVDARDSSPSRASQARFMWAMATRESSRDYYARNRSSGAFGKYQIMPFNWPAWSLKYLGDAHADQTPFNQERVAYGKLRDLHVWLGSWRRVAYWWLTGSSLRQERKWSAYARGYVDDIMRLRKQAPRAGLPSPQRSSSVARPGAWRRAGEDLGLRSKPDGKRWHKRGRLRGGQVLKVMATEVRRGHRWSRVLTADGRIGWVRQTRTVPTRRPDRPRAWRDVEDDGRDRQRQGRRMVRVRPR